MTRSRLNSFLFLVLAYAFFGHASAADKCRECHEAIGDKPSTMFQHDIHASKGISCAGCHGGNSQVDDMESAMNKRAGFRGVPKGDEITKACVRCHSNAAIMVKQFNSSLRINQWELLSQSVHGKLSTSGGERIVQCTTCHTAHGIVSSKNPSSPVHPLNVTKTCAQCHASASFMRKYNPSLPVDQLEKYRTSIHGMKNTKGDAKVASCASCHGSHDIRPALDPKSKVYAQTLPTTCGACHSNPEYMKGYNIPSDQVEKFSRSVHGKALLEKHDLAAPSCNDCHGNHGAIPPDVESISKVCGTCHALNASLFAASPHKKAFDSRKLPECETCHGNHEIVAATDELLGVSEEAVCAWCHKEDQNAKGYAVARTMRELIDSLRSAERNADSLVSVAEQKGMEIADAKFKLRDSRQARLEARTTVHSFDVETFREVVGKGMTVTSVVASEGQEAIDEYFFRRWGLGVATLIITILAVALYLTIRKIEKTQASEG